MGPAESREVNTETNARIRAHTTTRACLEGISAKPSAQTEPLIPPMTALGGLVVSRLAHLIERLSLREELVRRELGTGERSMAFAWPGRAMPLHGLV
jgi:hypothetical protein